MSSELCDRHKPPLIHHIFVILSIRASVLFLLPLDRRPLQCIVPPIEERLVVFRSILMMMTMSFAPGCPSLWQQLIIAPLLIHPRMYIDQQPHKHRHEEGAREDMGADDVERKVCQKYQTESFHNVQLVCDLCIDLAVLVMHIVYSAEKGQLM